MFGPQTNQELLYGAATGAANSFAETAKPLGADATHPDGYLGLHSNRKLVDISVALLMTFGKKWVPQNFQQGGRGALNYCVGDLTKLYTDEFRSQQSSSTGAQVLDYGIVPDVAGGFGGAGGGINTQSPVFTPSPEDDLIGVGAA